MLNVFPTLFLSLFAHALLRIVLGGIFIHLGYRHLFRDQVSLQALLYKHWPRLAHVAVYALAAAEIVIGMMFVVGARTQIAAIAAIILSIKILVFRRYLVHSSIPQPLFYVLMLAVSISLFITGAGALAFDLPI